MLLKDISANKIKTVLSNFYQNHINNLIHNADIYIYMTLAVSPPLVKMLHIVIF